ncbi:hypothetical protein LCGC14_2390210 [marine sediment metagenome]|uniref:Uncharacterized protein n=1 Tax=marine sediment metagenome TaxID=412755 RepID=A0A0F9BYC9_9ZZZZ
MTKWRCHIKYRGWHVWGFHTCDTAEEAADLFQRDREYKGREWVKPASIVDADAMTMQEQEEQDKDETDWGKDRKTPEQQAMFEKEGLVHAERVMRRFHEANYYVSAPKLLTIDREAVKRAQEKRWQQMRDAGYGLDAEAERRFEAAACAIRAAKDGENDLIEEFAEFYRDFQRQYGIDPDATLPSPN